MLLIDKINWLWIFGEGASDHGHNVADVSIGVQISKLALQLFSKQIAIAREHWPSTLELQARFDIEISDYLNDKADDQESSVACIHD